MSDNKVVNLILDAIATFDAIARSYDAMIDDVSLPQTFHEVGQSLDLTQRMLTAATDQLNERGSTIGLDNVVCSLEAGNKKAKLLEVIFKQVANLAAPTEASRLNCYHAVVRQHRNDSAVEVLMLGLLKDISVLTNGEIIDSKKIKDLRDVMDKLSAMEPSVPYNDPGGKFFHTGSGAQINNTGWGTQYNNTGNGSQYHASVMHFGGK